MAPLYLMLQAILLPSKLQVSFSRLAAKKVVPVQYEEDGDEYEGETERMQEQIIRDLSTKVVLEISLQHPITYDTHSICELVACSKLSKFFVQIAAGLLQLLSA